MGRRFRLVGAAALAGALALPLAAAAENAGAQESTVSVEDKEGARRGERLHLDCRGFHMRDGHAVGCHWSASRHPAFAAYRLMRASRAERPTAVHESRDRATTKALDRGARADAQYVYVLEVLDASGQVIGRSNPAGVRGERRPTRPAPGPGSGAPDAPALPGIPGAPEPPSAPGLPAVPPAPAVPEPAAPTLPPLPDLPEPPSVPALPGL